MFIGPVGKKYFLDEKERTQCRLNMYFLTNEPNLILILLATNNTLEFPDVNLEL